MADDMHDESIIIWDDHTSSPFLTEVADESRKVSHANTFPDAEIDMIFDNAQATPIENKTLRMSQALDKENIVPFIAENGQITPSTFKLTTSPRPNTITKPSHHVPIPASISKKRSQPAVITPAAKRSRSDHLPSPHQDLHKDDAQGIEANIDDTCFSAFSAVPDMTIFAKLQQARSSPPKQLQPDTQRQTIISNTHDYSPSATPRSTVSTRKVGDDTNSLLIDFTQQMDHFSKPTTNSTTRPQGLSPSRTESALLSHLTNQRSPAKPRISNFGGNKRSDLLNLLDFELPPPPTPKSTPAFSIREVEAIQSGLQSQISSLKAKLSGKEAEVDSLKKTLEDTERRVGESTEKERLEKNRREIAESDKDGWEKRSIEIEKVLEHVREEVHKSENEKESMILQAEESERKIEDLEIRITELNNQLINMPIVQSDGPTSGEDIQRLVQAQLDVKIEGVSRELHAVYKKKHETKVSTLKKGYEARYEKRCAELQEQIDNLIKVNEAIKISKDQTSTREVENRLEEAKQLTEHLAEIEKYKLGLDERSAKIVGLEAELQAVKSDNDRIMQELQEERSEKGELVAAVDEMLTLQMNETLPQEIVEDFRKSLSRPSGLRTPAPGMYSESKLSRPIPAPRVGSGKSKMMTNIERMGGGRPGL